MKKFIFTCLLLVATMLAFSQKIVERPTSTTKFKTLVKPGDIVINTATRTIYIVETGKLLGTNDDIASAVAAGKISAMLYSTANGYLDTTNLFPKLNVTWVWGTHSNFTNDSTANLVATVAKIGSMLQVTGDSVKPLTDGSGFLGTPTKEWGVVYSHYVGSAWLAGVKVTGTDSKFTTDSTTTSVAATSSTSKRFILTVAAGADTTAKTVGFIQIGGQLYWGNGTYYYKVTYAN